MSGQFIWDAIATLGIITFVLVALAAMTWWSVTEVLKVASHHLRPLVVGWTRKSVRRVREWKTSRRQ